MTDPEALSLHVSLSDSQISEICAGRLNWPRSLVPRMATMKLVHVTSTQNKKIEMTRVWLLDTSGAFVIGDACLDEDNLSSRYVP